MGFRTRLGGRRWHFCSNCPHWPDHADIEEADVAPPFAAWCRTCVRMCEADTCDLEWQADRMMGEALEAAWVRGQLRLRHRESN